MSKVWIKLTGKVWGTHKRGDIVEATPTGASGEYLAADGGGERWYYRTADIGGKDASSCEIVDQSAIQETAPPTDVGATNLATADILQELLKQKIKSITVEFK